MDNNEKAVKLIDCLEKGYMLTAEEYIFLIENCKGSTAEYLFSRAREVKHRYYGNKVYIRGLIEFTS